MASSRKNPDPEFVIRTNGGSVTCISEGGVWEGFQVIFVGSADGTIGIWDLESKRSVRNFHSESRNSILQLKKLDDSNILSHDRDGNILIWNLEEIAAVIKDRHIIYQYGFCPVTTLEYDLETLVAYQSNADSQLDVMSLTHRNVVYQLKPAEKLGMVMQARLFRDEENNRLCSVIGYEDGSVALWNVKDQVMICKIKTHAEAVMCLDIDSQCSKLVVGSADNKLVQVAMQMSTEESMKILRVMEIKSQGIASLRIRPDCKIVAAGCWDGKIRIFGWKKLKPLAILLFHSETINCIDFTRDNRLICGSKDGKISIWNIYKET